MNLQLCTCLLTVLLAHIHDSNQLPVARLEDAFDKFHTEFRERRTIIAPVVQPKIWAVIVAGSKDYENYRHQADALHAYQIVLRNGVPKEQIVLMTYDDIAYNTANPYKGNIINSLNGPNLYTNLTKDYIGEEVTPANFLNVLVGHSPEGKKVLKSTEYDYVFIYYSDHGGPGVIGFPNEEGVWSDDLTYTISYMKQYKKYSKMLFYIEACYSGSLFEGILADDLQVYALTAANSTQESYAVTYDYKRKTFLCDEWSAAWMADADYNDMKAKTIEQQYQLSVDKTKYSNPKQYGDLKVSILPVSAFFGPLGVMLPRLLGKRSEELEPEPTNATEDDTETRVSQDAVHGWICERRIKETDDPEEKAKYKGELDRVNANKGIITTIVHTIVSLLMTDVLSVGKAMTKKHPIKDHKCFVPVAKEFHKKCFSIFKNDQARVSLHSLASLCNSGVPVDVIKLTIGTVCSTAPALIDPVTGLFDNALESVPVVGDISKKATETLSKQIIPSVGSLTPALIQSLTPSSTTTQKKTTQTVLPKLNLPFKLF